MDLQQILIVLYTLIAIGALAMTRAEARAKGGVGLVQGAVGLLACAAWPLTMLVMMLAIVFAIRSTAPQTTSQTQAEA